MDRTFSLTYLSFRVELFAYLSTTKVEKVFMWACSPDGNLYVCAQGYGFSLFFFVSVNKDYFWVAPETKELIMRRSFFNSEYCKSPGGHEDGVAWYYYDACPPSTKTLETIKVKPSSDIIFFCFPLSKLFFSFCTVVRTAQKSLRVENCWFDPRENLGSLCSWLFFDTK